MHVRPKCFSCQLKNAPAVVAQDNAVWKNKPSLCKIFMQYSALHLQ